MIGLGVWFHTQRDEFIFREPSMWRYRTIVIVQRAYLAAGLARIPVTGVIAPATFSSTPWA
jgi:hypothetical protein